MAMDLASVITDMSAIVESEDFNKWRKDFVDRNVEVFEYGEENKLEYTPIHQEYEKGLEAQLEKALPSGVTMDAFCEKLAAEIAGSSSIPGIDDFARLVLSAAEFSSFKEMMLFEKAKRGDQDKSPDGPVAHTEVDVKAILKEHADLAEGIDDSADWNEVSTTPTTRICTKRVRLGESGWRTFILGIFHLELSFDEAVEMITCADPERVKLWNPSFKGSKAVRGNYEVDPHALVEVDLDLGLLIHLAGMPRRVLLRLSKRKDEPRPGALTHVMVPWNLAEDAYDASSFVNLKAYVIEPNANEPGKCTVTTLDMSPVPNWMTNATIGYLSPQMMAGQVQRYLKHARK